MMQPSTAAVMTLAEVQDTVRTDAELEEAVAKVARLDFTMLKRKLAEETGQSPEAVDESEAHYRQFLALALRYPDRKLCPNGPVDAFWHAHILDTEGYARDCDALFGRFLHHFPYFGMRGAADAADLATAFADTVDLFIRHFGVDPTAGDAHGRSCRPQRCP